MIVENPRVKKQHISRRKNSVKRHKNIREMFNRLYHEERKRYDDCLSETADFWGYSESYITKILRSN